MHCRNCSFACNAEAGYACICSCLSVISGHGDTSGAVVIPFTSCLNEAMADQDLPSSAN